MSRILALIPARGGSKGISNKNIASLAGKPLLAYTCEAAQHATTIDRTILSTDSNKIAMTGAEYGVETPFLRPGALAEDNTPMLDVILHVLETLQKTEGYIPDALLLLQPTSPLRTSQHIDEAVDLFYAKQANTVVSVTTVPHQFLPESVMRIKDDCLTPYKTGNLTLRRQDKEVLYARNGPAILLLRTSFLQEHNTFYGEQCYPYSMDEQSSIDIDHADDLAYAEFLLSSRAHLL